MTGQQVGYIEFALVPLVGGEGKTVSEDSKDRRVILALAAAENILILEDKPEGWEQAVLALIQKAASRIAQG